MSLSTTGNANPARCKSAPASRTSTSGDRLGAKPPPDLALDAGEQFSGLGKGGDSGRVVELRKFRIGDGEELEFRVEEERLHSCQPRPCAGLAGGLGGVVRSALLAAFHPKSVQVYSLT